MPPHRSDTALQHIHIVLGRNDDGDKRHPARLSLPDIIDGLHDPECIFFQLTRKTAALHRIQTHIRILLLIFPRKRPRHTVIRRQNARIIPVKRAVLKILLLRGISVKKYFGHMYDLLFALTAF